MTDIEPPGARASRRPSGVLEYVAALQQLDESVIGDAVFLVSDRNATLSPSDPPAVAIPESDPVGESPLMPTSSGVGYAAGDPLLAVVGREVGDSHAVESTGGRQSWSADAASAVTRGADPETLRIPPANGDEPTAVPPLPHETPAPADGSPTAVVQQSGGGGSAASVPAPVDGEPTAVVRQSGDGGALAPASVLRVPSTAAEPSPAADARIPAFRAAGSVPPGAGDDRAGRATGRDRRSVEEPTARIGAPGGSGRAREGTTPGAAREAPAGGDEPGDLPDGPSAEPADGDETAVAGAAVARPAADTAVGTAPGTGGGHGATFAEGGAEMLTNNDDTNPTRGTTASETGTMPGRPQQQADEPPVEATAAGDSAGGEGAGGEGAGGEGAGGEGVGGEGAADVVADAGIAAPTDIVGHPDTAGETDAAAGVLNSSGVAAVPGTTADIGGADTNGAVDVAESARLADAADVVGEPDASSGPDGAAAADVVGEPGASCGPDGAAAADVVGEPDASCGPDGAAAADVVGEPNASCGPGDAAAADVVGEARAAGDPEDAGEADVVGEADAAGGPDDVVEADTDHEVGVVGDADIAAAGRADVDAVDSAVSGGRAADEATSAAGPEAIAGPADDVETALTAGIGAGQRIAWDMPGEDESERTGEIVLLLPADEDESERTGEIVLRAPSAAEVDASPLPDGARTEPPAPEPQVESANGPDPAEDAEPEPRDAGRVEAEPESRDAGSRTSAEVTDADVGDPRAAVTRVTGSYPVVRRRPVIDTPSGGYSVINSSLPAGSGAYLSLNGNSAAYAALNGASGAYPIVAAEEDGRAVGAARVVGPPRRFVGSAPAEISAGQAPSRRADVWIATLVVAVAAVVILGVAYGIAVMSRPPAGQQVMLPPITIESAGATSTPSGPAPASTVRPSSGDTTPSTPPGGTAAGGATAGLTAAYSRVANTGFLGLTGYRGQVTITNDGTSPAAGWELTLSLLDGQTVSAVSGADHEQWGTMVRFTPAAGRTVPPGGSVTFTFDVPGWIQGEPTGCQLNGAACR
ncbi:cellulose binding domain-containing protein [Catenuloplanes atrovinosus]|uniref:CBM2 domain-containing protein n=1 Tax=Catenuloplanes atrovinosus TaxID=137266 RepID=A0AAE3YKT5_9ACTN|nr:cellulose binding domain-containing protein [Catenuloplanes atrovinosus]MDR7274023.1 hypothetical protein [Catenuloplanes atrovinosus]